MDFSDLEQKYGPTQMYNQMERERMGREASRPKEKKKKNFWLDQISTAGGILGGIGGSFIAPIAGTAAGAGAGSALGEALENLISSESATKNLVKEGVLGAVFGAGPIKLLKGAGAGAKALATGADDVAGAASKAATTSWLGRGTAKASQKLTKGGSGLKVGTNVGDINELDEISKLFQKHKIVGNPQTQLRKVDTTMSKLANEVDTMLAKKPVPAEGVATKIQQMIDDPTKFTDITLGDNGRKFLKSYLDETAKFTDARQLNKLIQKVNPTARRAYNKSLAGTSLTAKEEAALAFKSAGDDVLQEIAPAIKNTKKEMALLFKYNPQVAKFSETGFNIPFAGKMTTGVAAPARALQSKAGTTLSRFGEGTGNRGAMGAAGIGTRLGLSGLSTSAVNQQAATLEDALIDQSVNNPITQSNADPISMNTTMPANSSNINQQYTGNDEMSTPYSRENLMADLQRDPQNAKKYIEYYATLDEIFNPEVKAPKPLNQSQQERADLINALGLTEDAVNDGSINYGPIGSRVEGFKSMFNAADPETLAYKNTVSGLRAAITKARAGASLTEGELKMLKKYTPSDTDSEQVVRSKLEQLRALYGYSAPTQGADSLEDALVQYR